MVRLEPADVDAIENRIHNRGREAHRRLVQHQQIRRRGQPAADRQHLLLAARQRPGELIAPLGEDGNSSRCARRPLPGGRPAGIAPISRFSMTVSEAKTWRPSGTWAMPSCARSRAGRQQVLLPSNMIVPAAGDHAGNRLEQRCLAGAVRSDDGDELALLDLERDVAQRLEAAIGDVSDRQSLARSIHFLPR